MKTAQQTFCETGVPSPMCDPPSTWFNINSYELGFNDNIEQLPIWGYLPIPSEYGQYGLNDPYIRNLHAAAQTVAQTNTTQPPVAIPMDAKICPDGTAVGRGADGNFPPCAIINTVAPSTTGVVDSTISGLIAANPIASLVLAAFAGYMIFGKK